MEVGGVSLSFGCFFFSLSLSTFVERESRVRCERESLLISEERERGSQPSRRMEGERRVRRRGVGGWGQARRGAHRHRLAGGAEPAGGGDVSVGRRCAAGGRQRTQGSRVRKQGKGHGRCGCWRSRPGGEVAKPAAKRRASAATTGEARVSAGFLPLAREDFRWFRTLFTVPAARFPF